MGESTVLFRRSGGNKRTGEDEFEISDEYVRLQDKGQGLLVINFRAPKKNLKDIYEFFDNIDDMEPLYMNIAGTGEIEHYFRGVSPINEEEEEGWYKFGVTVQHLRKLI